MWLCWIPILTLSVDYPRRLNGFLDKQGNQALNEKCSSVCIFFIGGISPFFKNAPVKNFFVHLAFLVFFLGSYWRITKSKK